MPEEVKALTKAEEAGLRAEPSVPIRYSTRTWLATLDARDAEIAALKAGFDADGCTAAESCCGDIKAALVAEIAALKQEREDSARADAEVQETIKRYMDDAARLEAERDSARKDREMFREQVTDANNVLASVGWGDPEATTLGGCIKGLAKQRDSAVNETARKCAKDTCGLCASDRGWPVVERTEYVSEDGGAITAPVTYLAHKTDEGGIACRAERIRRAFPEAFEEEK